MTRTHDRRRPTAGGSPTGGPSVGGPQSRDLVQVAFGPSLLALLVITAVTLVQLVGANSDLTGTLGAVASMFLAVHQVPVTLDGQQLGALPLAPVALMVWATARQTARIIPPGGSWFLTRWIVASAVGGPLFLAAICLAVIHDASSVITALQTPNALRAFAGVAAVHGAGAFIGVVTRRGPALAARLRLPVWLADSVRPALVGAAALLALSTAVVAVSLVLHWATMHQLFSITDSFLGLLSLTVLSLLYLPNVVLGAAAVTVGSSSHIGFATFSAFTVFGGDIPALPILAAASTPPLGPVWVALLIVGAAAGVALGQQCALRPLPFGLALAKLAVSSALAAVGLAVLAHFGSGRLGNFGDVGVDQATFAPAAFFWFAVVGGLTVLMAGGIRPRPPATVSPHPDHAGTDGEGPEGEGPGEDDPLTGPIDPDPDTERVAVAPGGDPDEEALAEPEPTPPPPPVRPDPGAEDVEDLMFVDADIDDPDPDDPDEFGDLDGADGSGPPAPDPSRPDSRQ